MLRGITSVLEHKKWVFAYVVLFLLVYLLKSNSIDGAQFLMGLLALVPSVIGASSFDKSKLVKEE